MCKLDYKESWVPKNHQFILKSILKEISPGYSLEGLMIKLKLQSFASCKELIHSKRPWCWEGLGAGGEGKDRGWDGWMASPTQWTWVWVNSGSWWWTGRPGVLQFMGSQRVRHDWTDLNWTEISTIEWSHEPNHQWLVQAFSHCITLTLILLSLSSLYKNICDNAGLTRIIQDNLPISESFY